MRKWHRWISVVFGLFLLWIAVTGVLSHISTFGPTPTPTPAQLAAQTPPPGFVCPEGWRCTPPRLTSGLGSLTGVFHHLHSGEQFGPVGVFISLMSGCALIFFAVSGLWMYAQMLSRRRRAGRRALFWD